MHAQARRGTDCRVHGGYAQAESRRDGLTKQLQAPLPLPAMILGAKIPSSRPMPFLLSQAQAKSRRR